MAGWRFNTAAHRQSVKCDWQLGDVREKQGRMAEIERIRAVLIAAEESGTPTLGKEDIRAAVQADMRRDGGL